MAAEQAVIDRAYARLDDMRDKARAVAADVLDQGRGGTHQARFERDVRIEVTERRLAALRQADAGLVFGRMDREDGERLYVGRVAISDEDNEPLVVDWRAEAAAPFYRATPGVPLGLARRRHFLLRGRRLVGIEDDLLADARDDDLVLVGEAALLASLRRARTGRMADIVATIQREQDEIIRAPLPGILVVQGGPGTGKTAVALHRAAYLLYTYRFPLERAGVLLIGPNRVFLRYIEQVLPSLGEHTVTFATPATMLPAVNVTAVDRPEAVRVKGDVRMAAVLARAVRQRQRPLPRPATIPLGAHLLTLTPEDSRALVNRVKRRRGTHNSRRGTFERQLTSLLIDQWRGREGLAPDEAAPEDLERQLRRTRAYVTAVERMWPVLTPAALIHDLFSVPALLRLAAQGVLDEADWHVLVRPRERRLADVAWAEDDVALLDEAAVHLGPIPSRARPVAAADADELTVFERALVDAGDIDPTMRADLMDHLARWTRESAEDDQPDLATRTFGHVLIDEAQELSPMQARMIGRRVPSGSMTIVGDLGQASGDHAARRWDDVVSHLPHPRRTRVAELSVNYRTPVEVMEVAARVLAAATPGVVPPRSVRSSGVPPEVTSVSPDELVLAAAQAARAEMAAVGTGRVAVIAPGAVVAELRAALDAPDEGTTMLEQPIAVFTVDGAKGLEFDAVVVVEPAAIVAEKATGLRDPNAQTGLRDPNAQTGLRDPNAQTGLRGPNAQTGLRGPNAQMGLRALYVALTRTTNRLHLVHGLPLPPAMMGS